MTTAPSKLGPWMTMQSAMRASSSCSRPDPLRVATLGLNPSLQLFPAEDLDCAQRLALLGPRVGDNGKGGLWWHRAISSSVVDRSS